MSLQSQTLKVHVNNYKTVPKKQCIHTDFYETVIVEIHLLNKLCEHKTEIIQLNLFQASSILSEHQNDTVENH